MNKQYTVNFTLAEAVMALVILVQLVIILAIAHQARVAQEKSEAYVGMMQKALIIPRSPMLGGTNK